MKKSTKWFLVGSGTFVLALVGMFLFYVAVNRHENVNVDPLPVYPNSIPLNFDDINHVPDELYTRGYCSVTNMQIFNVFVTQDNFSQVYDYYNNLATKLQKQGVVIWTPNNIRSYNRSICYDGNEPRLSRVYSAAGVGMLNPDDPFDAYIIAQDFPNVGVGKTVVLLTYGYFSGD